MPKIVRQKRVQEIDHPEWIIDAQYGAMLLGCPTSAMMKYLGLSEFNYRCALAGKPLSDRAPRDLPQKIERLKAITRQLDHKEVKAFGKIFTTQYGPKKYRTEDDACPA